MSTETDLHPSAVKAIAALKLPATACRESGYERVLRQREHDANVQHDLLLDVVERLAKDAGYCGGNWARGIAAEALEALEQVNAAIDARDAADQVEAA